MRNAGVDIYLTGTHKLVWDGELKKMYVLFPCCALALCYASLWYPSELALTWNSYIVNFEKSQQSEPCTWRDKFFAKWFLAHPPPGSNWDINTSMVDAGWRLWRRLYSRLPSILATWWADVSFLNRFILELHLEWHCTINWVEYTCWVYVDSKSGMTARPFMVSFWKWKIGQNLFSDHICNECCSHHKRLCELYRLGLTGR